MGIRPTRAEREQQMLAVAEEVFATRGFQAASVDEICERVGVSKPMLYEYFGSKEGLLLACIARSRAELRDATAQSVIGATTAREALWRGLVAFFEFIDAHGRSWSMLRHEGLALVGSAADEVEAIRRQQTDLIAGFLGGLLPDLGDRAAPYAEIIVGAGERLALWRENRPDVTPTDAARLVFDALWPGIARSATASDPS